MGIPFDPKRELIVVPASFAGPGGSFLLTMAIDTGATYSIISPGVLMNAGYDPAQWTNSTWILTASGSALAHRVVVREVRALGWQRTNLEVLSLPLPPGLRVDGFLGLDFFRDHVLTVDFNLGEIEMTAGPSASATP